MGSTGTGGQSWEVELTGVGGLNAGLVGQGNNQPIRGGAFVNARTLDGKEVAGGGSVGKGSGNWWGTASCNTRFTRIKRTSQVTIGVSCP